MALRTGILAFCCATIVALATPAAALTVLDATYRETIELTFVGLPALNLSGTDPAAPESLIQPLVTGTNSAGATSFSGRATTSVGGAGGGAAPQATAEATATVENLILVDSGEGFARAAATITFELAIEPLVPGAPTNLPVPLDFVSMGFASVTADPLFSGRFFAYALLTIYRNDPEEPQVLESRFALVECGLVLATGCTGAPQIAQFDEVVTVSFIPDTETALVAQSAIGYVVPAGQAGLDQHATGSYYAFIDPIVRISPGFMVDIGGVMVPGDQAYGLSYSANLIPEPASGLLALCGVALIALARARSRRGAA